MIISVLFQVSDDTGMKFSFGDFRLMTIRAAQNLQRRGHNKKQMISIISSNVPHLAPIVFASLCLGGPVNTIPTTPKREILRILEMTEPKLIFCEIKVFDLVQQCLAELKIDAEIFTLNGSTDDAEPVEKLFVATGIEEEFM